jgi:alpha-tubulin suppressor-like RCC1 family protein
MIQTNGVSSVLSWQPNSHNFGIIPINGPHPTKDFVFRNDGNIPSAGCSAPTLADAVNFTIVTDSCGAGTLGAGQQCSVVVQPSPGSLGPKSTTLSRSCGATDYPTQAITYDAAVTAPSLAWSPLSHDFGFVTVGISSAPKTFTLLNSGTEAATGCSAPVLSNSIDFSLTPSSLCSAASLSAGASCTVQVRAKPQSAGIKTTTLSRTCSSGGTPTTLQEQIVVNGSNATLAWTPSTYDFGSISVGGTSADQIFTLLNSGTGAATGCQNPGLYDPVNFEITQNTCTNTTLAAGSSCQVAVRGRPFSPGTKATTLFRICSSGIIQTAQNGITVEGTTSGGGPTAGVEWSHSSFSFGVVRDVCPSIPHDFRFRHTIASSGVASGCGAPTLTGPHAGDFEILEDTCGTASLSKPSYCSVKVRVKAASAFGVRTAELRRSCAQGGDAVIALATDRVNAIISAVASGSSHTCILLDDKRVACAGIQDAGNPSGTQLGIDLPMGYPVLVEGLDEVTELASGHNFTCARKTNGSIWCWGSNDQGQLGTASAGAYESIPVQVSGINWASRISAGRTHACAITSGGTVKCWGANDFGQLGDGSTTSSTGPVTALGLISATEISANIFSTCALRSDGTVWCWGNNAYGSVGDGTSGNNKLQPTQVSSITDAIAIGNGGYHACAVLTNGQARCWGQNFFGQVGDGTTVQRTTPVAVSGLSGITRISAGGGSSCALGSDSKVRCWGLNASGQLGDGTSANRSTPVTVLGPAGSQLSNATSISVGTSHACAVRTDGSTRCWGSDDFEQLGDGQDNLLYAVPRQWTPFVGPAAISLGETHSCALLTSGEVRCWGDNQRGSLGDGTRVSTHLPKTVLNLSLATAVSSGRQFSCARLADSTVKCWGDIPGGSIPNEAVTITGLTDVTQIGAGARHVCARLSNGTVQCWGDNESGQLGDGTFIPRSAPTLVPNLSGVVAVAGGPRHTCALMSDNSVKCWGSNADGQLGVTSPAPSPNPVSVPGVSSASQLALGASHTCARLSDGSVKCWGASGLVGIPGVTSGVSVPTQVTGLTGVTSIAAGWGKEGYTCATANGGSIFCWGVNSESAFGNAKGGRTTPLVQRYYGTPDQTLAITDAKPDKLAAGGAHTCTIRANDQVWCWGSNANGRVGVNIYELRAISGF